jgi:subtilisin-like proprotein convertase family protein
VPTGATATFGTNPVVPTATTSLVISNTGAATPGNYTLSLTGATVSNTVTATVNLSLFAGTPGVATLLTPTQGATNVSLSPLLSWAAATDGQNYRVEVATDAGFTNVVYSATVTGLSSQLSGNLNPDSVYYWRVTAYNTCGTGTPTPPASFTTAYMVCRNPNLSIPDNNTAGVTDTMVLTTAGTLSDLNVYVEINHTYVGDLNIQLQRVATTTTSAMLFQSSSCDGADILAVFDDEASQAASGMCSGSSPAVNGNVRPSEVLSAFDGGVLATTWRIKVFDDSSQDTGTLVRWCLMPAVTVAGLPTAAFTVTPATAMIGQVVTFTNLTTGTAPLSYVWAFGDGLTSTAESPTHTYALSATYTVVLTATNTAGSHSAQRVLVVTGLQQRLYLPLVLRAAPQGVK